MLDYDSFVEALKTATKTINEASADSDKDSLLTYVCQEIADRISVYLNLAPNVDNTFEFDQRLVKIGARIVSGVFTQTKTNISGETVDTSISSISDNGQSISYGNATRNYLATATDGELFGGFTELLKPYRRVHVVSRHR